MSRHVRKLCSHKLVVRHLLQNTCFLYAFSPWSKCSKVNADVAEWLRRLTRNQIPSGSVGSNPTICVSLLNSYKCLKVLSEIVSFDCEPIFYLAKIYHRHLRKVLPRVRSTGVAVYWSPWFSHAKQALYLFQLLKNFEILNQFISRRWKTKHQLRSRDRVWPDRNCGFFNIWVWKRVIFLCFLIHRKQIFTYNGCRIVVRIVLKTRVICKACFSFKTVALPGGELNPGLPRDRRGYWPLYYRGSCG